MKTHHTPFSICLTCGYTLSAASNLTGKGRPRPHDVTMCLNCGALHQFNKEMRLQPISEAQAVAGLKWQQIAVMRLAHREIEKRGRIPQRETKQ